MMVLPAVRSRAARVLRALLLLVTLVLGAAVHELHHAVDRACDRDGGHPCTACAGLHGSTLAAAETQAPAPLPTAWRIEAPRPRSAPAPAHLVAAPPRAPPAA